MTPQARAEKCAALMFANDAASPGLGMELAATKPYWLGQSVAVLGASSIAAPYRAALEAQSVPVTLADAERMTLEGLKAAYAALKETTP